MDIYCPICGEPWDMDELHSVIEAQGYNFEDAKAMYPDSNERQRVYERDWYNPLLKEFRTKGCRGVFDNPSCKPRRTGITAASQAAFEIMGDDVDGIASMMEDAEMMGLFDE